MGVYDDERPFDYPDSSQGEVQPPDFTIQVSNIFPASDPRDAVVQMVEWLLGNAQSAGYRVTNDDTNESMFIDADDAYEWWNKEDR